MHIIKYFEEYKLPLKNGGEIHFSIEGSVNDISIINVRKWINKLFPSFIIRKIKTFLKKKEKEAQ